MATAHLKGSARFEFGSDQHLLAVPLLDKTLVHTRTRHEWWSADHSTRETIAVGTAAVQDIEATIRFENQPSALLAMFAAALEDGVTLLYYEEESATPISCDLVSVDGGTSGIVLTPDPDRYGFGEWSCRVRLRASDWSSIL